MSSRVILRITSVILVILLTTTLLKAQTWYDSDWLYRSPVTVSNPGTNFLTDLQVNIILRASNFDFTKSNINGYDLRLTSSDGTTLIPFWIESWISGDTASIWVKVPSIPPSGTTLFLYYGNTQATSISSGLVSRHI